LEIDYFSNYSEFEIIFDKLIYINININIYLNLKKEDTCEMCLPKVWFRSENSKVVRVSTARLVDQRNLDFCNFPERL
jgi:hypothetical protein